MSYESLKAAIEAVITDNANNEITGEVLRDLLVDNVVPILGDAKYKGAVTPATVPNPPEADVFYLAKENGVYANFAGFELKDEIVLFKWFGAAGWTKDTLYYKPSKNWLDFRGKNFVGNEKLVHEAIKSVRVYGAESGASYQINVLCKNNSTFGNRINIVPSTGGGGYGEVQPKRIDGTAIDTNGFNVIKMVNDEGVEFIIEIDYAGLTDGAILINGGATYINPSVHHPKNEYALLDYISKDLKSREAITEVVNFSDLMNIENHVTVNIDYSKTQTPAYGFKANVLQLNCTAGGNFFRLYDSLPFNLDASAFDISKPLYVEMQYKVIAGNWNFRFWSVPGAISISKSLSNTSPNEIKRVRFSLDAATIGATELINYFDCSTGAGGELLISDLRFYQTDFLENTPTNGDQLTPKNAIGLNSADFSTQTVKNISEQTKVSRVKKNIVLAGSSITWGEGGIKDGFGGFVDREYFKKVWSNTIPAEALLYSETPATFSNPKTFTGAAKQLTGTGKKVEFNIFGDELAICQAFKRTTDYGIMTVKADGVVIGEFDNVNRTIGNNTDNFVGDGSKVKFILSEQFTYNHVITVAGVSKSSSINAGGYGGSFPADKDVFIIRALNDNGEVVHVAWFKVAPANGAAVVIDYDYGKVIMHEKSAVGQTTSDIINESNYGDGNTVFDPAIPAGLSSGLEFRSIDERSFFVHSFETSKSRKIEIEITGGTNPYFIIDYVSNRFYNFMNAGIGGWKLSLLLDNNGVNDWNNFFKDFKPDVIINESATNDDWDFNTRKVTRTLTGVTPTELKAMWQLDIEGNASYNSGNDTFTVTRRTGLVTSLDKFSLVSAQIIGSTVDVGDIVRIGNYYGDNKQVALREIDTVDLATGEITWLIPLNADHILNIDSLDDLIGAEISIRDLSGYETLYQQLIDNIKKTSAKTELLIVNPGLADYFARGLWGYDIVHNRLCAQNTKCSVIDVTDWLYDVHKNNVTGAIFENLTANGSTEYSLGFSGHWQGFKVLVNGLDVYGKDCYIESGYGYTYDSSLSGAALGNSSLLVTKAAKLVFYRNAPASGTIVVQRADKVWSGDFTHPNTYGSIIYGKSYIENLKTKM